MWVEPEDEARVPESFTHRTSSVSKVVPLENFTVLDPLTGGAYGVSNVEEILYSAFFAQIGNGAGLVSSFVFTNPSSTETASARVDFSDDEGQDLRLPIDGTSQSHVSFEVPPLGSVEFSTSGEGTTTVAGAAQARGDLPLGGVVRFTVPGLGIAGVGVSRLVDTFIVPIDRDVLSGLSTGIAVLNQGPSGNLKLVLSDLGGIQQAETEIEMSHNGHLARFVQELFPALGDFQGTLTVAGDSVSATAIQLGTTAGQFTTLPVVSVTPLLAGGTVHFSQFANGGGFRSSLFLLNPSTDQARGEVAFFGDDGEALSIAINGEAAASRIPFEIPPQGGAILGTDGQGALVVGSARAILTEGVVGGVLRFSAPGLGIAGVGASGPFTDFITPVSRSTASGLNTGVAVSATGAAITLNLTLRDSTGAAVGAPVQTNLAAHGHLARFINELFPGVDTADFKGTLTVTAAGGTIAATAIELGSQPGQFTTLPVNPLQ